MEDFLPMDTMYRCIMLHSQLSHSMQLWPSGIAEDEESKSSSIVELRFESVHREFPGELL